MEGREIKQIREKLGLSQAHFGQLLGVHAMTVSKWERGALSPNGYQETLMKTFNTTAEQSQAKGQIEGILLTAGLVAALLFLLSKK